MFHRKSFFLFPYFDRKNGFCLCFHQLLIVKKSCPLKSVNMVELALFLSIWNVNHFDKWPAGAVKSI